MGHAFPLGSADTEYMTTTRETLTDRLASVRADSAQFNRATKDNIGGTRGAALRAFLHAYAGGKCAVCESDTTMEQGKRNSAQIGHIIPATAFGVARAGFVPGNVVNLCRACNDSIGDTDMSMHLDKWTVAYVPLTWSLKPVKSGRVGEHDDKARAARLARGWTA